MSQYPSEERLMDEFARMLKISNHQERISTAMEQYRHLLAVGDSDRAQAILQSVLYEQMIETKARLVAKLFDDGYAGVKAVKTDDAFKTLAQWKLCAIDDMSFRAPCRTVFHRIGAGGADVIDVSGTMSASSPSAGWLTPVTAPFCTTRTTTCSSSCITPIQMCQTIQMKPAIAI